MLAPGVGAAERVQHVSCQLIILTGCRGAQTLSTPVERFDIPVFFGLGSVCLGFLNNYNFQKLGHMAPMKSDRLLKNTALTGAIARTRPPLAGPPHPRALNTEPAIARASQ